LAFLRVKIIIIAIDGIALGGNAITRAHVLVPGVADGALDGSTLAFAVLATPDEVVRA